MSIEENLENTLAMFINLVERILSEQAEMIANSKKITEAATNDGPYTRPEARMDYSDLD